MDVHTIRQQMKTRSIYDIPLRVTFYARVSSESDEQLNSLDNQIGYYRDFIQRNNAWTFVDGYIDEGLSGMTTKKRENFHRMIEDGKAGLFDLIITKEITRFARNTLDSIQYTRDLLSAGVGVFFQNDNINTFEEDSELRLTIMSGIAQDELRKLSSRVKFGHQQAIKNNVVLGNSRIFGYRKDNKRLVIDEDEAPMVRELFELYASDRYSMKQIETLFWEKGYRNHNGKKIAHTTMSGMISNPKYKGYYVGNKVRIVDMFTKKQKFLPAEEWVMFKDETGEIVPAIVSEELWDAANAVLARRSKDVKQRQNQCNHGNLLTGKLFCTHCGAAYYRRDSKDKKGNVNSKWVCSGKIKNGADSCPSLPLYEDELKPVLFDVFRQTEADADAMIDRYIAMYQSIHQEGKGIAQQLDRVRARRELAEKKKSKLLEYNVTGQISDRDFLQMNRQCDSEIAQAEREISELEEQQNSDASFREHIATLRRVLEEAKRDAANGLINREFVEKYINSILVTVENDKIDLQIKLFTGEMTTRYLEKLERRTGHTFNNMIDTYEAPFASIKNSEGSWIPFEYSLLLLNSGKMITDDVVLIDIPTKRIIDYFFDVAKNATKYGFDWADDFGYTETDIKALGATSYLINIFNGILGFDGASWALLFQQFAGSMDSYDKKYGEDIAILICTESDKELQATTEKVKLLSDLLNTDGDLGKLLSFTSDMTDFQVGSLYKQCEAVLDGVKTGNSSAVEYSRAYQALEKALDKQTWFSHTGANILDVQKGVTSATGKAFSFLDVGVKVAEIVGYAQEFQNQDEFSLAAFTHYLETANSGLELPDAMKASMIDYSDALSKSIAGYTRKRFLENIDQWMLDAAKEQAPLHKVLGTQAAAILIAWDIASNTIPFIANGLSDADNFELALYSMVFQGDTFLNYLSKRNSVFADSGNISAENMYELSQYCYIYLKSCYVTREAALASLTNKSSSTKEKIQPLIDYQNDINTEIAKILVELKGANETNDDLVFGFLPTNNENYLSKYDDSQLIRWIETFGQKALDAFGLLPSEFIFSSGAGGWATEITLNDDGTFYGQYYDSDMGDSGTGYSNGTVYICDFSGKFTMPQKISEYIYSMNLESLHVEGAPGTVYYENEMRYIVSDPYGFDNADEFLIYLPGIAMSDLPEGFINWLHAFLNVQTTETLPYYGIYNVGGEKGFVAYGTDTNKDKSDNTVKTDNEWKDAYESILLQHPESTPFIYGSKTIYTDTEYTIHDIDKDGIPELIVKEDITNYYIYSYNGTDAISSDMNFWHYADCLYEYEGNGIIVHDGGSGRDRVEYASLYSMVNNKIVREKETMSTAANSAEELYAFLDSLTPINDFHPITDYSYLSNWSNQQTQRVSA